MRYLLLIYNAPETWERTSPSERQGITEAYLAFTKEIAESGELLGGEPLQGLETATTVRVRGGKTATTDGPFAETKEVLGGYYYVDVKDLDRAIELAGKIPGARRGTVEVRPVLEIPV